jgi:hypothetical protein
MEFLPLAILHLSWAGFSVKVNVLPDFTPKEYLFETHTDKGQERWEVYASVETPEESKEALRNAI